MAAEESFDCVGFNRLQELHELGSRSNRESVRGVGDDVGVNAIGKVKPDGAASGTAALRVIVGTVSMTEFRLDAASGLMTGFRSWDSTDPILQTTSELELTQWPDFTAVSAPSSS
jgi:hypothetical protein